MAHSTSCSRRSARCSRPDQQQVADELTRVCRPGGRIGLANWTPEGLAGSSLAIIDQHVPSAPAAAALRSPSAWGTTVRLRELLGDRVAELRTRRRSTDVCAASPADLVAFNRACAGPTRAAFAQLDQAGQERLASDLATDLERFNRARDGTLAAAAEYLQATTVRASPDASDQRRSGQSHSRPPWILKVTRTLSRAPLLGPYERSALSSMSTPGCRSPIGTCKASHGRTATGRLAAKGP